MSKKFLSKGTARAGFTLIELLVVISIIGILVGLLLPAVQQVREAARRTQCTNNLRQIALATLNYETAFQKLPYGIAPYYQTSPESPALDGKWAWSTFILPQMEQVNLYDVLSPGSVTPINLGGSLGNRFVNPVSDPIVQYINKTIPSFSCPSDSFEIINSQRNPNVVGSVMVAGPNGTPIPQVASTNYVAANTGSYCDGNNGSGAFCSAVQTRLRDFTDGQTNVILFSERTYDTVRKSGSSLTPLQLAPTGAGLLYGSRGMNGLPGPNNSFTVATTAVTSGGNHGASDVMFSAWGGVNINPPTLFDCTLSTPGSGNKFQGVSSRHPGGVLVARADGSVGFVAETVSYDFNHNNVNTPWEQFIGRNDGAVLTGID